MGITKIPSARHYIDQEDIGSVMAALKSGCLSGGEQTAKFEAEFAKYVGVKHAIAVSSGTSGLHMSVRTLGIKEGDEVITTPFSFIASVNCLLYERARPVFVDIDETTLNINSNLIEETVGDKTRAILAVDVFGTPSDADKINAISKKYQLPVIGDSCEALGSSYKNKMVGSFYDLSVFGFFANKQITTGEGGMVVTNSDVSDKILRSLRNQGRAIKGNWVFHERLGYNYRITEMEAALGLSQLKKLEWMTKRRNAITNLYEKYLSGIEDVEFLKVPEGCSVSRFLFVVRIKNGKRRRVMEALDKSNVGYKTYFYPLHLQPYIKSKFGFKEGMFPVCEKVAEETLSLPFYIGLKENDISKICRVVKLSL